MDHKNIQWYPGHMAKTMRMIRANLKKVDIVLELLDARIPYASRNPDVAKLTSGKPSIILLNKASLADREQTQKWSKVYSDKSKIYADDLNTCIATDCISGEGFGKMIARIKELSKQKIDKCKARGMVSVSPRVMVLGIPNVGKSSLINRLAGSKKAKTENRPGVTLEEQWIKTNFGFDMLDTPGVLWPKFEDKNVAENISAVGSIKDVILDTDYVASRLCRRLRKYYPELLENRYGISVEIAASDLSDIEFLNLIGEKRGYILKKGEIDFDRTTTAFLTEFRTGKIGHITLDHISNS